MSLHDKAKSKGYTDTGVIWKHVGTSLSNLLKLGVHRQKAWEWANTRDLYGIKFVAGRNFSPADSALRILHSCEE